ncbi:MAG: 50S ribosomal protein L37e [Candidatus Thermoplasmatota archaeon]|nr:50S ribosomal protein L37e [Candidatus Thermoplasmatota archaeon]
MSKGTPAQGKKNKVTHLRCRRCGRHAYHKRHKTCAACGFGASSKLRTFAWSKRH